MKKFSFATVFAAMALMTYAYITFLGLVYWNSGFIAKPLFITLAFVVLVTAAIIVMCMAKANRYQRIRLLGQTIIGLIVLAAFVLSAVPFTNFLRVIAMQDQLRQEVANVLKAAEAENTHYNNYATRRLSDYQERLEEVVAFKKRSPIDYERTLKPLAGNTDEERISLLAHSLQRRLQPDSLHFTQQQRQQWLRGIGEASIWNVLLPANIEKLTSEVMDWIGEYKQMAALPPYPGETPSPIAFTTFQTGLNKLTAEYKQMHSPSVTAIVVSLLCFFIMLLPYWLTEEDLRHKA